jgi:uncharacterized membrane protein YkvA (DUF1232 family)
MDMIHRVKEKKRFNMKPDQNLLSKVAEFIKSAAAKIDMSKVKELLAKAPALLEIVGKVKLLAPYVSKVKMLIQLVSDYVHGRYSTSWYNIALIVATLLYVISPIDIIPDVIPVIGYLDDLAALILLFKSLGSEFSRYQDWQKE